MELKCNECGKVSDTKPKVKRMRNKIDKHYFKCKHCKHSYVIGYIDEDIRKDRKRIRKLTKKNLGNGLYVNEIQRLNTLINSKMNKLKQEVEL